jgi:multidrug efflux pump subunit AcrA (membrane-fusion protein)
MLGSGERFIYVYKADGTVSYQKVELGRRMQDKYEVLSGIADGDEVVVTGQSVLKDGLAVERAN